MGLNKSTGNMYPGVKTWNPLGGKCLHGCTYCSTNTLMRYPVIKEKYSGLLRIDYKALNKNLGQDKTIFVCAQNDLFAEGVPNVYIEQIITRCDKPDNTYLFQTKNPDGFINWLPWFPAKTILCITIETNRHYPQMGNTPTTIQRAYDFNPIFNFKKQVTIEPVMDFDIPALIVLIKQCDPDSVNIGADSKNNNLPEPSKEKLLALIDELKKFTVIDQKRNLNRILNQ
jgi:hypothetical protein